MSDSEDDLVSYGTPLEPLEEDEIPNKRPRLLEDQVVKDKQGRRRFHGAFTGGFSAGFFNTVGSLEGWTPSSFKSSKSKKQGIFKQKPEDFMDEEDLSEFGIAPVVLKAKQDYTTLNKKEFPALHKATSLGNFLLQDLLKPVRETVGIKLLRKMGWKPGQGVGPRLSKKEKKNILKIRQKTYGCQLPPGSVERKVEMDLGSDSEEDDLELAPSDCEPVLQEGRNDSCGLGYEGLERRPVLSGNFPKRGDGNTEGKNKKCRFSSQAFGVGAFEEEDEDIYTPDDMSRYDFALGGDLFREINKSTDNLSLSLVGVLDGFVLQTKKRSKKNYPLPILPKDYKPHHEIRLSRFDKLLLNDRSKCDSNVDFEERRKLFKVESEEVLEGRKQTESIISSVKINENEFRPFSSNPEKQKRYENYLKLLKVGKKELLYYLQPLSMADCDRLKEAMEFEKAALLFKPLTGGMGDRFLTARQPDDLCDPLGVVEKHIEESDNRIKAARMNMFGPLTRKMEDWAPSSLLCKRFNIPEPNKSHTHSSEKKARKSNLNLFRVAQSQMKNMEKIEESGNLESSFRKELNEDKSEVKELKHEEIKEVRDNVDLFRAIFLVSEDEEEEKYSKDVTGKTEPRLTEQSSQSDTLYEEKLMNSKRNLSPPSGIFRNIDLESLSVNQKITRVRQKDKGEECQVGTVETESLSLNLVYGPKLPEKIVVKALSSSNETFRDGAVWVEKKPHGGKKHKKKNKKNKKSVVESKHKRKKPRG